MNAILAFVIIALIIVTGVALVVRSYNKLVMLKNNAEKAFANIDVLLKQRADEIPNLIAVVKETRAFEESTLTNLTKLRTQFLSTADMAGRVQVANEMNKGLMQVMAVSENYPDLKSNASFMMLQSRVSGMEDAIADRRELFNESVNMYNIGIAEIPEVFFAKMLKYNPQPLLAVTEVEKKYDGVTF